MTAPLCRCGCGKTIEKRPYETPRQAEKRIAKGVYRDKCLKAITPLKPERGKPPLELISHNVGRVETVAQPLEVPVVDEGYRRHVRGFPCLIPGCGNPSIFHHQPKRAHGTKGGLCTDYRGVNLCEWHHTLGGTVALPYSYHGMGKVTGWKFWSYYGIDVETTIHNLNRIWLEQGHKFKEG